MSHTETTYKYWMIIIAACAVLYGCGGGGSSSTGSEVAASAGLKIFPADANAPGDTVLLQGEGFEKDCKIRLYLDTDTLTDVSSSKNGTVKAQVVIPERTTKGSHTISARSMDGSGCNKAINQATVKLAIIERQPVINLTRTEGRPGTAVEVAGRGFCGETDCSTARVLINGFVAADQISVATDGTFITNALIPAVEAAGDITVVALQTDAAGKELSAFGDIVVTVRPDIFEGPK